MPMNYPRVAISDSVVPRTSQPVFQHLLDTYASETNKVISVWSGFSNPDLAYRPHPRSSTVEDIMKHQLLSERRFFGEFLGLAEPSPAEILPKTQTVAAYVGRMQELAAPRLQQLAPRDEPWWLERVKFFDVERERIWIFWRRVLHTVPHRTQLTI